jgi:integrase
MMRGMKTAPLVKNALHHVGENLYRSQSSGIYYALFKRDGKQIRRSLKTADKELARRKLADLRSQVNRLTADDAKSLPFTEYDPKHPKRLIGGLAKRWLDVAATTLKPTSRVRRECAIKQLAPHFRGVTVRNLRREHVESWAMAHSKSGRSARDFNITRDTLRLILDYAVEHGMLLENPARNLKRRKEPKNALQIPTIGEYRTILTQMRSADGKRDGDNSADLIEFLALSGCRLSEATAMTWGDVNFKSQMFTVTGGEAGTKNYEARVVPLFPNLEQFLLRLREKQRTPPKPTTLLFKVASGRKSLENACRKLGLPLYHHHTFRHFFCSNAIEKTGGHFKTVAGWLGHKDGGVLVARTYGHLRDEHSAAMAKRMTLDDDPA